MNYLFLHDTKGMCLASDNRYTPLSQALITHKELTEKLLNSETVCYDVVVRGEFVYKANELEFLDLSKAECEATTGLEIELSQVEDDIYCIEHNWERYGDYWIIDCPALDVRYIHSDKLNVNKTIPISHVE